MINQKSYKQKSVNISSQHSSKIIMNFLSHSESVSIYINVIDFSFLLMLHKTYLCLQIGDLNFLDFGNGYYYSNQAITSIIKVFKFQLQVTCLSTMLHNSTQSLPIRRQSIFNIQVCEAGDQTNKISDFIYILSHQSLAGSQTDADFYTFTKQILTKAWVKQRSEVVCRTQQNKEGLRVVL